jgi:hypothetical protein
MRDVGDILFLSWNNQYYREPCKITKVNQKKDHTTYDIELINKQYGWLKNEEKVVLHFSDVHYCDLKEKI